MLSHRLAILIQFILSYLNYFAKLYKLTQLHFDYFAFGLKNIRKLSILL